MKTEIVEALWCDCYKCEDCKAIDDALEYARELGAWNAYDPYTVDEWIEAHDKDVRELIDIAYAEGQEQKRKDDAWQIRLYGHQED